MKRTVEVARSHGFRVVAFALASVALGVVLWRERGAIDVFPWRLSWPLFCVAVCGFATGPLVGATVFWILVHDLTGRSAPLATGRLWMRGFLARYVPFGSLTLVVRVRGRSALGASRTEVVSATVYEQLCCVLGAALAALALSLSGSRLVLLPGVVIAVSIGLLIAHRRLWRLRLVPARTSALVAAALLAACGWFGAGAAVWLLVRGMTPGAPAFLYLTGVYALAWLAGFVVPIAPSGLGAREATLIAILAPRFGVGPAAAIAVSIRFANIAGDLLAAGVVEGRAALSARRLGPLVRASRCS